MNEYIKNIGKSCIKTSKEETVPNHLRVDLKLIQLEVLFGILYRKDNLLIPLKKMIRL